MKKQIIKSMAFILFLSIIGMNMNAVAQHGKANCKKQQSFQMQQHQDCMIPDLTEDQKQKMEKLRIKFHKETLQIKNELNEKSARLKTLMSAEKVNMDDINKTVEETGAIKTRLMKAKVAHKQEVRKLLNEKQRLMFDSKMMGQHHGMGNMNKGCHQKGHMNKKGKCCPKR